MNTVKAIISPFHDAAKGIQEDFEILYTMLNFGVKKNMTDFSFSGLRVPILLQDWKLHDTAPAVDPLEIRKNAHELTLFQEHLYDRVVGLADNDRMLRETWRINDSTRRFREQELINPDTSVCVVDLTVGLINALFLQETDKATAVFDRCLSRRIEFAHIIAGQVHENKAVAS